MEYKLVAKENIHYIIVPRLKDLGLNHCFTTIDMDMAVKTNGSMEDIKLNLAKIYDFMKIKPGILYSGKQVHSNKIEIVNNEGQGIKDDFGRFIPGTDGLITSKRHISLISRFADCIPILIYDPINKVQANIHSGWKGTLGQIGMRGVDLLEREFNSNPEDLVVVLGPAIGREDFEVEEDVMEMFQNKFDFQSHIISQKNEKKYLIDLKAVYNRLLKDRGILERNIISIDLSTASTDYLHSYRRDKNKFGLMAVISQII